MQHETTKSEETVPLLTQNDDSEACVGDVSVSVVRNDGVESEQQALKVYVAAAEKSVEESEKNVAAAEKAVEKSEKIVATAEKAIVSNLKRYII